MKIHCHIVKQKSVCSCMNAVFPGKWIGCEGICAMVPSLIRENVRSFYAYTTPCRLEFSWAMTVFPWASNARRNTGTKILLAVGYYSPDVTSQGTWIFSATAVITLNLAFLHDRQQRIAESENTEGMRFPLGVQYEVNSRWSVCRVMKGAHSQLAHINMRCFLVLCTWFRIVSAFCIFAVFR